jgi:hypothetical protein
MGEYSVTQVMAPYHFEQIFAVRFSQLLILWTTFFPTLKITTVKNSSCVKELFFLPQNKSVHRLNRLLLDKIPVVSRSFFSVDTICDHYPHRISELTAPYRTSTVPFSIEDWCSNHALKKS